MFEIKLRNALQTVLTEFGEEEVLRIKKALLDKDIIASGKLYKSIGFTIKQGDFEIGLEINGEDYLKWVDEGRRPGRFPPINKIQQWVRQKGIRPVGISEKSLVYLIGRKIQKKGIPAKRILNLRQTDLDKKIETAVRDIIISELVPNIIQ